MSDDQAPKDYKESFIHLEYQYTAGSATTTFLNQVKRAGWLDKHVLNVRLFMFRLEGVAQDAELQHPLKCP